MTQRDRTLKSISCRERNKMGLLSDFTRETFFQKIRQVEEEDRITYRQPYSYYYATKRQYPKSIKSKPSWDSLSKSSSEESIEYEVINSYEMGSLGLVPVKAEIEFEKEPKATKISPPKCDTKKLNFDPVAVKLLSDLGLLNKFERSDCNTLTLRKRFIQKKRQYYPY
ncbi:uncharacterized protein TNCT_622311 [Trichonephila clavata]|uniref:Uncharacterized protein n=1 Tax=Trichonephila clavata TaxID=2740835 RepID=A0A8X6LIE7_TRICU|nr:uncharacterized protein TNCT_622311 [Trichonephila clavata]